MRPDAPNWRDLLACAAEHYRAGRAREADELLRPRLERGDAPPQALGLGAMLAHALGHLPRALALMERALAEAPQDAAMRYNHGVLLRESGRLADAEAAFRNVLDIDPGNVPAAVQLAEILNAAGRPEEAVTLCRQQLATSDADPLVHLALADGLRLTGEFDAAAAVLEGAAARWPGDPRVPSRLGILRRGQGRPNEAVQSYQASLALRPEHATTLGNLGLARLDLGQLEAALECFDRALELAPQAADTRLNRAAVLSRLGRRAEALDEARSVSAAHPRHAAAHAAVAAILSGDRDPDSLAEGETAARRALELDPAEAAAWDSLGIVLMKRGEEGGAFEAGRRAVELAPANVDYWLHLADNQARDGELAPALATLGAALARHPANAELHRQQGIALLRSGETDAALESLDRCLAQRPADQRAIAHKAVALARLGHLDAMNDLLGLDRFVRRVRFREVGPFASVEAFNRQLAADIRNHPTLRWEPVGLAATGGALTGELLDAPTDAIRVFERELRRAIDDLRADLEADERHPFLHRIPGKYRLNTWATLVPQQGEINAHIHEEAWLSGAYYAELPAAMAAGRDTRAGWLELGRPSGELPPVPEHVLRYLEPAEGLLVLFPSYLFHRTLPFQGQGERISLSFDLEPVEGEEG